jgi:hypothetical protein
MTTRSGKVTQALSRSFAIRVSTVADTERQFVPERWPASTLGAPTALSSQSQRLAGRHNLAVKAAYACRPSPESGPQLSAVTEVPLRRTGAGRGLQLPSCTETMAKPAAGVRHLA